MSPLRDPVPQWSVWLLFSLVFLCSHPVWPDFSHLGHFLTSVLKYTVVEQFFGLLFHKKYLLRLTNFWMGDILGYFRRPLGDLLAKNPVALLSSKYADQCRSYSASCSGARKYFLVAWNVLKPTCAGLCGFFLFENLTICSTL
jgi:hypothetical protein